MKLFAGAVWMLLFSLMVTSGFTQTYNWKPSKDKDGIKVYVAENPVSKFKVIKVECTLVGTFDKLASVLTDIGHLKDWGFNIKVSYLIKKFSPYDLYYYTETSIPWPMSNRDAVIHMRITRDSLQRFMLVNLTGENKFVPDKTGNVRVVSLNINWYVTMPTSNTISIVYTFEANPGGSLPAWLVNSFVEKGPYETFKKLSEVLKRK
jgi:hypothetical protein